MIECFFSFFMCKKALPVKGQGLPAHEDNVFMS